MSNVSKNNLQLILQKEKYLNEIETVDKMAVIAAQRKIIDLTLQMEKEGTIVFPEGV